MEKRKENWKNVFAIAMCLSLFFVQCSSPQPKEKSITSFADSSFKKTNETDSLKQQTATSMQSEITCPKCGNKKTETMPTDVCLLSYTCQKCQTVLHPKEGDCCVFCTYGDHKCPSKQ